MDASAYTPHMPDTTLLEAFEYISQVPGKDVRGQLIDAFQVWFRIPEDRVSTIEKLIGELHNASLLIDDIEDEIYREKLKIKKVADELSDTFDDMLSNY